MKTISIRQPWASLIVHGIKDIENRTWKCPEKYIGKRVLIHASGKSLNYDNFYDSVLTNEQILALSENKEWGNFNFCTGAIIGSIVIASCVQSHSSVWADRGVYNWVLANPVMFPEPIPAKGKLSFWEYDRILEPVADGDHKICMCRICVDEKVQVMSMGNYFVCKYCGGRWYK